MRRLHAAVTVPFLALALGGCTSTQQSSSTGKFKGDEKAVAQVVEDLQSAGQSKDAQKVCSNVLAANLVEELKAGGGNCVDEIDKAITDADDYDLEVAGVTVNGAKATAQVRAGKGKDRRTLTFEFAKERGGWRATSLGA
jgi:outer membrane PBP1 activator LpoA protein